MITLTIANLTQFQCHAESGDICLTLRQPTKSATLTLILSIHEADEIASKIEQALMEYNPKAAEAYSPDDIVAPCLEHDPPLSREELKEQIHGFPDGPEEDRY